MNQSPPAIRHLKPKIDESAIDDDDWEDVVEESGKSSVGEQLQFHRVNPKANLTSGPSLITRMAQSQSRSGPIKPNGPSLVTLPNDSAKVLPTAQSPSRVLPMGSLNDVSRWYTHAPALSPRTIRLNMIAHELPDDRKNLFTERDQNSLCCISKDGATYKTHRPFIDKSKPGLNDPPWYVEVEEKVW